MPAGFQRSNPETGFISIDENYKNHALRAAGSITLTPFLGRWEGTVTLPVNRPVMAFRATQKTAIVRTDISSGGAVYSYLFRSYEGPATVNYYQFDDPAFGQSWGGTAGLQVFDAASQITFDSRLRYMRVIDWFAGNEPFAEPFPNLAFTKTYPAGRVPAVVQGNVRSRVRSTLFWPPNQYTNFLTALYVGQSGSVLSFAEDEEEISITTGSELRYTKPAYSYLVIDVAGF